MQLATQTAVLATRPPASHAQPPAAITTSAPHTHTRCPAHLGQQRQREGLPPEVLLGCHAQLAHEAAHVVVGVRPLQLLVAQGQLQLQLPHHALVDAPNLLQRKGRAHGRQGRAAQQGSGRAWQWVVTSTVGEWVVQDFSRQAKPDQSYAPHQPPTLTLAWGTTAQISLKVRGLPVWRQARKTMAASTAAWLLPLMDLALS